MRGARGFASHMAGELDKLTDHPLEQPGHCAVADGGDQGSDKTADDHTFDKPIANQQNEGRHCQRKNGAKEVGVDEFEADKTQKPMDEPGTTLMTADAIKAEPKSRTRSPRPRRPTIKSTTAPNAHTRAQVSNSSSMEDTAGIFFQKSGTMCQFVQAEKSIAARIASRNLPEEEMQTTDDPLQV
jgi:hypothetical protein